MQPYPQTILEFREWFATEQACRDYIAKLRWPEGFVCPRCRTAKAWTRKRGNYWCSECGYQVSATAGTLFHDTHKLRRALVRPGRDRLSGVVEVDEIFIGGERPGKRGRGAANKTLVVIAAQQTEGGIGRIRLCRVANAAGESLEPAVQQMVQPGSEVHTDGWRGYNGLAALSYQRKILRESPDLGGNLLPLANRVASLLKRWLLGTHQGAVQSSHLDYYLDEYTFRFNRRTSKSRGLLFYRLINQAVHLGPVLGSELSEKPQASSA